MSEDSTTSNASTIDDKKNGEVYKTEKDNLVKFLKSVMLAVMYLFIFFVLSGLVLYGSKIGQSNILPTDELCYPYTDTYPTFPTKQGSADNNVQGKIMNIFTTYLADPQVSEKIRIPYTKENASNKILDLFREYKMKHKSNFLVNYFISILESMLHFNYVSLSYALNAMNMLPEILVLLFGPILFVIASTIIFLCDNVYLIYLWFANFTWFFKKDANAESVESTAPPKWEQIQITDWFDVGCALFLVLTFFILFWIVLFCLPVLPFVTLTYCIISLLTYQCTIGASKGNSGFTVLGDLFKYYKVEIMTIFCLTLIISAFTHLGPAAGSFSIVTVALIYFQIIPIPLFTSVDISNFTPPTDNHQAQKVCAKRPKTSGGGIRLDSMKRECDVDVIKRLKALSKILRG